MKEYRLRKKSGVAERGHDVCGKKEDSQAQEKVCGRRDDAVVLPSSVGIFVMIDG